MDTYNLNTVFSSIDINGRYSYKNQPEITMWNLARFAETLIPLISSNKEEAIKKWNERLKRQPQSKEEIKDLMEKNNPVIIPRNHLVEEALNKANENDYTFFNKLLLALKSPFDYTKDYGDYVKVPKEGKISYKTYCGT